MKIKNLILLFPLLVLFGCTNDEMEKELENTKRELAKAELMLKNIRESIKNQHDDEGELVHLVFFKLKKKKDIEVFIVNTKRLYETASFKEFEIGPFENKNDPRAMKEYDLAMQLTFENDYQFQKYQNHRVHQEVKEELKSYLAGPPITYDFVKHF